LHLSIVDQEGRKSQNRWVYAKIGLMGSKDQNNKTKEKFQCPVCGTSVAPVEIHGQIFCAKCKTLLGTCCEGIPTKDSEEEF